MNRHSARRGGGELGSEGALLVVEPAPASEGEWCVRRREVRGWELFWRVRVGVAECDAVLLLSLGMSLLLVWLRLSLACGPACICACVGVCAHACALQHPAQRPAIVSTYAHPTLSPVLTQPYAAAAVDPCQGKTRPPPSAATPPRQRQTITSGNGSSVPVNGSAASVHGSNASGNRGRPARRARAGGR
eukprot:559537-Rhodomonas_salina.1